MKKYEKEVEKSLLQSEIEARDAIKRDYAAALKRVQERIAKLTEEYQEHPELASKIYQRKYQENLERELKKALSGLSDQSYDKTMDYLQSSYQDAYIGANYCLNKQGYDLFLMYDQKKMMDAIYDTARGFKLSAATYGENVDKLRRKLQQELSRGLNSGMDYSTISKLASQKVQMSFNQTKRIIATEGHRVQNISKLQAAFEARAQGADQVKMWSSTLDEKTRERHQMLHGQLRELEDSFTALGAEAQYPGGFGIASEDIACRCVLCLRARKVLSRKEKNQLRSYAEFKEKYKNVVATADFMIKPETSGMNITKERINITRAIGQLPEKVREALESGTKIVVSQSRSSAYDYAADVIIIQKGAGVDSVYHECGHMFEAKVMKDKAKVDAFKRKLTENVTISDLIFETYIDNYGNEKEVMVISESSRNKGFVSEYQTRIYADRFEDAFDLDGNLKIDLMEEFISEPFREFMEHPETFKDDYPEMYQLIVEGLQ